MAGWNNQTKIPTGVRLYGGRNGHREQKHKQLKANDRRCDKRNVAEKGIDTKNDNRIEQPSIRTSKKKIKTAEENECEPGTSYDHQKIHDTRYEKAADQTTATKT